MGRTKRKRETKKKTGPACNPRIVQDKQTIELMRWLSKNGWKRELPLYPTDFPTTGRGLMTKTAVNKGDTLVRIPVGLLITARTACESHIYQFLDKNVKYDGHELLALYLVWEKHMSQQSFWFPYINTLPLKLSTPLFWSQEPIDLPLFILEVIKISRTNMEESYQKFLDNVQCNQSKCLHCSLDIGDIFNKKDFIWAWCIVNTRAIYIPPQKNLPPHVSNSLALAPFLDLFNHVPSAQVEAMLVETDHSYQVKTLVPVPKYGQVFIEYGAHSNLKLLVDYGFTVPNNQHDSIALSLDDIYDVIKQVNQISLVNMSQTKYRFLKQHNLLQNPCLTREGLCWKAMSIIFILTSDITNLKLLESKVYSSLYNQDEVNSINIIGTLLVTNKIKEFEGYIKLFTPTENDHIAVTLYLEECVSLLKVCLETVNEKVHY